MRFPLLLAMFLLAGCSGRASILELQAKKQAIEERIAIQREGVEGLADIMEGRGPEDTEFVLDLTKGEFPGNLRQYLEVQVAILRRLNSDLERVEKQIGDVISSN
jgi:hypothetical protein